MRSSAAPNKTDRRRIKSWCLNYSSNSNGFFWISSLLLLILLGQTQVVDGQNVFALAFECDDNYQDISGIPEPRPMGHLLQICVTPDLATRQREIFMRSVERLTIAQTNGSASMELVKDNVEVSSQDTLMLCQPNMILCVIQTRLSKELFYNPPEGTLTASGAVQLQYYTEEEEGGRRKLQTKVLDLVFGHRRMQNGYMGEAGIRFVIPVENVDRPDVAAVKKTEDDLNTWWEEAPGWLKAVTIAVSVLLIVAIILVCCFGCCCSLCRRIKEKEEQNNNNGPSVKRESTNTTVRIETALAQQKSLRSNVVPAEHSVAPSERSSTVDGIEQIPITIPMDEDDDDEEDDDDDDDDESITITEQAPRRDHKIRPHESMVQRTWQENSISDYNRSSVIGEGNDNDMSSGILDMSMYQSTRLAVDPEEDIILNEGDTPVAHDICFDAEDHPGTQDFTKAVINAVKKHGEQKYGPPIYRTIKKQLPNRRFWVCETEDGPDVWRELSKKELIEFVGQSFNEMQEERLKTSTKTSKKKTKKKKKKKAKDPSVNGQEVDEVSRNLVESQNNLEGENDDEGSIDSAT